MANNIDLYNKDCFLGLKDIQNDSIDCVISDIPYNIKYNNLDWDTNFDIRELSKELYRATKLNSNIIVFGGWGNIREVWNTFENSGFILHNLICFDRIKGRGATKNLTSTREEIFWFIKKENNNITFNKEFSTIVKKTKGMGYKNGSIYRSLSNVWTDVSPIAPMSKEYIGNACQKPISLIRRLVRLFSNKQDLVMDVTFGSGATPISCLEEDRQFIGFEKDSKLCDITKDRIKKVENKLF